MRKFIHKKKTRQTPAFLFPLIKAIIYGLLIYFFFKNKALIIILLFEVLDVGKILLRQNMPPIAIDLEFIFGVVAAYYYSFVVSIIIYFLSIVNRTLFLCIEIRHITKCFRHIGLFFVVLIFRDQNFLMISMIALFSNYLLKYLGFLMLGQSPVEKMQFHVPNILFTSAFFYIIYIIYTYLPFLSARA